jgi:transposase-like protein
MTHYPAATKLLAIQLYESGEVTYAQIAERLGIRQAERIKKWYQAYRREGEAAFQKPIGRRPKQAGERTQLEQLQMENALLKKYHTELRTSMLARRDIGSSNTTGRRTR